MTAKKKTAQDRMVSNLKVERRALLKRTKALEKVVVAQEGRIKGLKGQLDKAAKLVKKLSAGVREFLK